MLSIKDLYYSLKHLSWGSLSEPHINVLNTSGVCMYVCIRTSCRKYICIRWITIVALWKYTCKHACSYFSAVSQPNLVGILLSNINLLGSWYGTDPPEKQKRVWCSERLFLSHAWDGVEWRKECKLLDWGATPPHVTRKVTQNTRPSLSRTCGEGLGTRLSSLVLSSGLAEWG